MFGRPAYFFGGDNLPGSTTRPSLAPSASSALKETSAVSLGEDESIVGACWNGETHLLVTSAHSVRVFHVEHLQVPLRTWNFRPDQEHLLTSSAVIVGQKRTSSSNSAFETSRSIVAMQNGRTAIAWKHSDESLATFRRVDLPSPVTELLGGFFPDIAIAVTNTGDVICLDSDLQNVGSLSFQADAKFCAPRTARSLSAPRPRRRSRSNSNIGMVDSLSSAVPRGEGDAPEWIVHWAKHAPYRSGAGGKSVLLFVLLRKPNDMFCNDLLVVHELSRPRGTSSTISLKTISQHDIGAQVCAASISVSRESSGMYNHKLQIIGHYASARTGGHASDDDRESSTDRAFLRILTFPDGPHGPPSTVSSRCIGDSTNHKDELKQPMKRRRMSRGRLASTVSKISDAKLQQRTSFALVAVTARHSVIARIDDASDGIQCSGWDSGFCVPVANMMVPCRNEGVVLSASEASAAAVRGGCSSRGVKLELCSDGNTLALVGKKTLVVFAVKCAEPTLANVVGCGQELGSDVSNNHVQAIVMPDSSPQSFSLLTGAPDATVWDINEGSGAAAGKLENEALRAAVDASTSEEFNAAVIAHLNCVDPPPLLTQNYIRAAVTACHRHGINARETLQQLIATGRVSAWACPALIRIVMNCSSQMLKNRKRKTSTKKRMKSLSLQSNDPSTDGLMLVEECLVNVQDLHEDAIVELLQFVIRNTDTSDGESVASCVRLLRLIVALPYNGSFLKTFLRRLSMLETRLMLIFMRKMIKEEAERQGKDTGCPTMSQAIGWTIILLDAHFQSIVVGSRSQPKIAQVIKALVQDIQDLIETCRCSENIKAQISHLKLSKQLPFEPVPAYCIESFQAFEIDL